MTRKRSCFNITLILFFITVSCKTEDMNHSTLDVQGHRGARGLMPENTIPSFLKALESGVRTLELDLAVSKDKQLIVSHEPYMNHVISLDSLGQIISETSEKDHNIYEMTYDQIVRYDVGSKNHPSFPNQMKVVVSKPLLKDVITAVETYIKANDLEPIKYNIEIKSWPDGDDNFHPDPQAFSDLVYEFLVAHMEKSLVNVQSFDFRVLQYYHHRYPDIELAVLIENDLTIDENLNELGFIPEIYSCYYKLLDAEKVEYLHKKGMKVIPWTVNEQADIEQILKCDVDGIISDYPDRVIQIIQQ